MRARSLSICVRLFDRLLDVFGGNVVRGSHWTFATIVTTHAAHAMHAVAARATRAVMEHPRSFVIAAIGFTADVDDHLRRWAMRAAGERAHGNEAKCDQFGKSCHARKSTHKRLNLTRHFTTSNVLAKTQSWTMNARVHLKQQRRDTRLPRVAT